MSKLQKKRYLCLRVFPISQHNRERMFSKALLWTPVHSDPREMFTESVMRKKFQLYERSKLYLTQWLILCARP